LKGVRRNIEKMAAKTVILVGFEVFTSGDGAKNNNRATAGLKA